MIKISPGNIKMGSMPNTSVIPIVDCKKGAPCTKKCYAIKAWRQYKNVRDAWGHNSREWRRRPAQAAESVVEWVQRRKPKYFRVHVAGDFMNQRHLHYWHWVAWKCPDTIFRAFTKRFDLDYSYGPKNFITGFSVWPGAAKPRKKKGVRCFSYVQDGTETRIPEGTLECKNDCDTCGHVCWENPQDFWFHLH